MSETIEKDPHYSESNLIWLDMEMTIKEHYYEAVNMIANMFVYIFDGLNARFAKELNAVQVDVWSLSDRAGAASLHAARLPQADAHSLLR